MEQIRTLHQYDDYAAYLAHQARKLDEIHDVLDSYEVHYPKLLEDRLTHHDDIRPGASVLCLAARLGGEVRAFQDLGCFAVGLDINPGMENQHVLHGDFHDIQFPDHSVDVVFTNSLDHVLDFDKLIGEVTRVLKPDGRLILEIVRGEENGYIPEEYEVSIWQTIDDVLHLFLDAGYEITGRHGFEQPWRGEHVSLVYKGEVVKDHREFLVDLINERQLTTIAEVGVHRGATAEAILAHCPCVADYYMIDPWCAYPAELCGVDSSSGWTQSKWDDIYEEAKRRVEPCEGRVHVWRHSSCEVAGLFENGALNLVFIDAIHTESAVDADIRAWLPKVKPDGILAGHDWWDTGVYAQKHAGVKRAVSAFFDTAIVHVGTPPESWGSVWYVDKAEWLRSGRRVVFCTESAKIAWALRPHVENLAEMIQGHWQAEIVDWDQRDALAQMPKSGVPTYIATFIGAKSVHEMYGIAQNWIITGWHSIREIVRLDHRLRTGEDLSEKDATAFLRTMDEDTYRVCDAFRELMSQYAAVYCYNSRMVKIIGDDCVTLLHPCVDVETYKPSPSTHHEKLVVGWAGNTMREPHKKDIALLRSVVSLVEKSPLLEFDYRACKGLRPNLPGLSKERMPGFYRDLDILVITAVDEGTPRTVLEAGASGVPVVSTPCGIVPEYIVDGETGYVLDRNPTPEAFLDKLEYLATHRDVLDTMKGNIRVCSVVDWSVAARRQAWLDLFECFPGPVIAAKAQAHIVQNSTPVFRCHLLGLAHVPTHRDVSACAYTQKVVKLAKMLKALGHTVYFYGGEGSSVECDEYIQVVSNQDRIDCYGDYDWHTQFFKHSGKDSCHATFNENAIREINDRKQNNGDFLLCPMGNYDKPIADAVGLTTVESGIGYRGVFAKYKVWESYAWMHYIYGVRKSHDGSWYDCVIPNYFDPADFPYQLEKDDYFLFIGRLVRRKGLDVAVQVTRELGARLIVAGQGWLVNKTEGLHITDSHVEHVGCVGPERRKELMGRAKAVFVPTYYIEPFGGVAVEAQMCGTPVITTDWGAMTETILHGKTGYRCRTFDDFVWAAKNVGQIHPADCHAWAVKNYSMGRVQQMYQKYLETLDDLHRKGWYELHPERTELDWLQRDYG